MIDAFHFVAANPGYRAVFVQSRDLDEIVAMDTAFNKIIQQLADFFAVRNPLLEPGQQKFNCYSECWSGKCAWNTR